MKINQNWQSQKRGYGKELLFLVSLLGSTSSALANLPSSSTQTMPATLLDSQNTSAWVVTLSGGPSWISGGETQTFYLAPEIEKTYTADKPTNTVGEGDLFLGVQKPLYNKLLGQLGFDFAATGNAGLSGDIWDDADPEFNNHNYDYDINHKAFALKGKLLLDMNLPVIPWISASAGIGFNQASHFTNNSTIFQALPNPDFSDNTTSSFTYTLAVGIQRIITKNWQAGVSYEFADWGKSELGNAEGQTMGSGLSLSHLYSNAVLLNITYLA
ncbi:MAG: porin family protein [Legionellales bacterium]|nr:porin family protein [Legionellales bacterium]